MKEILDVAVCRAPPHGILVATEVGQVHLLSDPSGPIEQTWHCHGGRALRVGWVGRHPIAWNTDQASHRVWALRSDGSVTDHSVPTHADIAPTDEGFFVASHAVRLAFHDLAPDGTTSREERRVESPGGYNPGTLAAARTGAVAIHSAEVFQIQTQPGRWWQTVRSSADCFAFSPSGSWIAASTFHPDASYLHCYRVTDREIVLETSYAVRALPERIASLTWSDDEQWIAMRAREGDVRVFRRDGWVPGLWTSSACPPVFFADGLITVHESRDLLQLRSLVGVPQRTWIRLRPTTPEIFDVSGNRLMRRGDKVVTFDRRPRPHPSAIYEVVTGVRKDDDTRGKPLDSVVARLRLGFPLPNDSLLDSDQSMLEEIERRDGQEIDLRETRDLLERLYVDHPTELEQLRMHLPVSDSAGSVASAGPTPEPARPVATAALVTPTNLAAPVAAQRENDTTEVGTDDMKSLISARDMQIIEDVLQMGSGYVLNFSDRTMREFFAAEFDIDIDADEYKTDGYSKAKRLRAFLRMTQPPLLGQVLEKLLEHRLLYNNEISPEVLTHYRARANQLGVGTSAPTPPLPASSRGPMPPASARAPGPTDTAPAPARARAGELMPTARGKVQVLFLSANPDEDNPLAVEKEENRIFKVRNASKHQERIAIESLPDVDLPELAKSLRLHSPTILHFSGHGEPDGALVMRDDNGEIYEMHPDGLAQLVALDKDTIRLVVLNACFSSELADLLVVNIDCVVGMTAAVSDDAAILFAHTFYSALFDGLSVARAFATSAAAVTARYNAERNTPVLRCRAGVDPTAVYLVS